MNMSNSEIPDYVGAIAGEDEDEYVEETQPQPDGDGCGWAFALVLCLVIIPALVASVFVWSVG
jgi:hypothetical protein